MRSGIFRLVLVSTIRSSYHSIESKNAERRGSRVSVVSSSSNKARVLYINDE